MLTLNDGRAELWQWDTGRTLTVDADCSQVHFSNKVFGRSIDVDVVDGAAIIPDVLLQADKDLNVWAFVGTAENGYTKISKTFKVNRRNKPADYVFTPTDQTTLAELSGRLDRIEESQDPDAIKNAVEDYLAQNPVEVPVDSVNGKTGAVQLTAADVGAIAYETDPTVPEWAKQPQKPTYTADEVGAVSQAGLQEATNEALAQAKASGEFDGADGAPGKDGADGQPGENGTDGYSPTANVTQNDNGATITITDKNGTTTATVTNGKDGADGNPGADGSPGEKGADGKSAYAYAVEGGYTGTEAEFAAKLAAEKLANPNALTFTGAVTGSYDGSEAVTVEIPSGGSGGGAWHTIGTQMMDGVETAVYFDLAGETIIQIIVTAGWNKALTATKATVSLTLATGDTVQFTQQTMNATAFSPKNIFTIFGNSKNCRQMIFSKAEGARYSQVQGSFGVAYGYNQKAEGTVKDAIATGITITFDVAPSNAAVVKVEGM